MCQNSALTSQLAFIPFSSKEFSFISSLSFPNPACLRASKLVCAALSSGGTLGFSGAELSSFCYVLFPRSVRAADERLWWSGGLQACSRCFWCSCEGCRKCRPLSLCPYFLCPCGWKLSSDNLQHSDQLVTFISQLWFSYNYLSQLFAISTLGFSQILRFERYSLRIFNFRC